MTAPARSVHVQPEFRLSVYTDASQFAGAEIALENLLGAMSPSIRVSVVGIDTAVVERLAAARPDTEAVLVRAVIGREDLLGIGALRRGIAATQPDIFQANLANPWACRYAVLAALTIRHPRVLAVEHLPTVPASARLRLLKRLTSTRLAAHVAVGEEVARSVESMARLHPGTIQVIHNGVPDVTLSPVPRTSRGLAVGSLARLHHDKGLDNLISAISRIPDVHLVLVGDGPERAELERQANELDVRDRVEFVGWTSQPRHHLPAFDVFALPSRSEGFPLATIEAMLAGLPVVATDVGDAGVAIVDGETGFVIPPDDVPALVGALQRLLDAPSLRESMGAAGRARALARYTDVAMAQAYEQVYATVLGVDLAVAPDSMARASSTASSARSPVSVREPETGRRADRRALMILEHGVLGGTEITAIELAATVAARGRWDVAFACPPGPATELARARGLEVLPMPPMSDPPALTTRHVRAIGQLIDARHPDLVHAWKPKTIHAAFLAAHMRRGLPVLGSVTDMNMPPGLPPRMPITFVTADIAELDRRRDARSFVLEPPIRSDTDRMEAVDISDFRALHGLDDDTIHIVIVSRVDHVMKWEGIARTVGAVEALASEFAVDLLVVGDGDARQELDALAADANRQVGRCVVHVLGAATDPRPAYAVADIVVGMGTSVERAMSFGKPTVVVGESGYVETFDELTSDRIMAAGFYGVGPRTGAPELEEQLRALLTDVHRRRALGAFSRDVVVERFDVHRVAEDLMGFYDEVAAGPVSRGPMALVVVGGQVAKGMVRRSRRTVARSLRWLGRRR